MRATSSPSRVPKSNSPKNGSAASMPSIRVSTWLDSVPRSRTWVKPPTAPVRLTAKPGTSRSTSETMRTWRASICSAVIRVSDEPTLSGSTPSVARVAVTTSSETAAPSSAANAGDPNSNAAMPALKRYFPGMRAPSASAS